jgi:hypothetical protein
VRIGGVILGVATLMWGFLQAPFDHIHPGEDLDHETLSAPMHVHVHNTLATHAPSVATYTASEDNEIDVLWNAATSAHVELPLDGELGQRVFIPPASAASAQVLIPQHRGHDPPESSPKAPRAPPA